MSSGPPPSRYRVIERGGRLQVIDTWAARRPPRSADYAEPVPLDDLDRSDPVAADPVADSGPGDGRPWSDSAQGPGVSPMDLDRPTPSAPLPPRASRIAAESPELLRNIAATICGDKRDGDGRLVLQTARFYDSRAPRAIALDLDGERELGLAMLAALALAVAAVIFTATLGWPGIVVGVIAVGLARQVKVIATPWLDRLAARTR